LKNTRLLRSLILRRCDVRHKVRLTPQDFGGLASEPF